MHKLLYVIGILFLGNAILALPQVKSAMHQILLALEFGFGAMSLGLGAIVQSLNRR